MVSQQINLPTYEQQDIIKQNTEDILANMSDSYTIEGFFIQKVSTHAMQSVTWLQVSGQGKLLYLDVHPSLASNYLSLEITIDGLTRSFPLSSPFSNGGCLSLNFKFNSQLIIRQVSTTSGSGTTYPSNVVYILD